MVSETARKGPDCRQQYCNDDSGQKNVCEQKAQIGIVEMIEDVETDPSFWDQERFHHDRNDESQRQRYLQRRKDLATASKGMTRVN
jgi:hypothetical protein